MWDFDFCFYLYEFNVVSNSGVDDLGVFLSIFCLYREGIWICIVLNYFFRFFDLKEVDWVVEFEFVCECLDFSVSGIVFWL